MDLKEMRKKHNLTQMKLSEACGCDRSMIGKIETGAVYPSVKLAKKIATILNFDWTSFYEEESHEKDNTGHDGRGNGRAGASY